MNLGILQCKKVRRVSKIALEKRQKGKMEKSKRHLNHGYCCILMAYRSKLKELSILNTETN